MDDSPSLRSLDGIGRSLGTERPSVSPSPPTTRGEKPAGREPVARERFRDVLEGKEPARDEARPEPADSAVEAAPQPALLAEDDPALAESPTSTEVPGETPLPELTPGEGSFPSSGVDAAAEAPPFAVAAPAPAPSPADPPSAPPAHETTAATIAEGAPSRSAAPTSGVAPLADPAGGVPSTLRGTAIAEPAIESTPVSANEVHAPRREAPLVAVDSVLRQVRIAMQPARQSATIHLEPAHLGRLAVRLEIDGGEVRALVRAERPEAIALLERHLPELRAALTSAGLEPGEIDLSLADPRSSDSPFRDSWTGSEERAPRRSRVAQTLDELTIHDVRISVRAPIGETTVDTYA